MRRAMLGNNMIDLDKLTKPELTFLKSRRDFFCIHCKKPVIFKNGTRKRAHFSHGKEGLSVTNPESAAHILVKHTMTKWLRDQNITAEIEKRFPTIDRIADVYFEYENTKYVLEIQKSPMSDGEFNQRIADYKAIDATVLWLFLGDIIEKENQFTLPPVMIGRENQRLLHFCTKTAHLQIFEKPVFLTTKNIYANPLRGKLEEFSIINLIKEQQEELYFDRNWLEIKQHFRMRGWYYAGKLERKLLEQCLIRGFNLSLLPTEIGWPVGGNSMKKSLFIWQAYILLTLMKHFHPGAVFSLTDLSTLLRREYQMMTDKNIQAQLLGYIKWLTMFGIIKEVEGAFKYMKHSEIMSTLEEAMEKDEKFVEVVVNLLKV